jgi:hypothetical protein
MQTVLLRKEDRFAPAGSAESVLSVLGQVPANVQVRNVSRNGLGIGAPMPVPAGSVAVVTCGRLEITGVVRHCRQDESGTYILGFSIARIIKARTGTDI